MEEVQDEDKDKIINKEPTPPSSPISSLSLEESLTPRRTRSIKELYEMTN